MNRRRTWPLLGVLTLVLGVASACGAPTQQAGSKPADPAAKPAQAPAAAPGAGSEAKKVAAAPPTRPVEFVVTTSAGGGSDVYARYIVSIIDKYKLSPQPFVVVNKPGGAGAVGMTYLHQKKGDPHAILITLNAVFTTPQMQKLPFKNTASDFTPIALMALDPFFLWTSTDRWKSWNDLLKDARERPLSSVGTGTKQEDEIMFALLSQAAGTKPFKYVPEQGGGEVAAKVAGKHVEVSVNQPSEAAPFYPDRMRPLVAFTAERMSKYPDVPTFKEVGLGEHKQLEYYQVRGIIAAPGIPEANRQWLIELFQKVYETPEWREFLDKNLMLGKFVAGDEFGKLLKQYDDLHEQLVKQLGWAQS